MRCPCLPEWDSIVAQGLLATVEQRELRGLPIDWTDPSPTYMQGTVGFSTWRTSYILNDIKVTALQTSTQ